MTQYTRRLTAVTIVLVAIITALSFVLSYAALVGVAQEVKSGWLAYIWPLIIDLPIVAFSVVALLAVTLQRSAIAPRLLVALATVATVYFNYVHVPTPDGLQAAITHKAVAVSAPVMLLLSFETLVWLLQVVAPATATQRDAIAPQQIATKPEPVAIAPKPDATQVTTAQRREQVAKLRQTKTVAELAEMFGVSPSTISRDMKGL
jgi:hypothetical protein